MKPFRSRWLIVLLATAFASHATPSNKAALERHYERFLSRELNRCTTCHLPSDAKNPERLEDFPHNPFGDRLRALGDEQNLAARLTAIAREDSDGDGVDNESEVLAGTNPGDAKAEPAAEQLATLAAKRAELALMLASYRWRPFERVKRPDVPVVQSIAWVRTPIDAFIAAEHEKRGLTPRPEAPKATLLRRVYLDLIGLSPTPEEQRAFAADTAPGAYEELVDRLLADPRHGERWARHWMDIWRYSDWAGWTDGKQIRDSARHIWRWRDWIVESLNADKGYERMVLEMLAADELAPSDPQTARATGFLVRNYKMLSREQWLEDTVKHTAQAFLGITLGCAKCHDHMTDPISQADYYQVRAIFEPHQVRTDRVPGELDLEKDGLPRVYDVEKDAPTYFLVRGDERKPDKDRVMPPGVPRALGGNRLAIAPVSLPREVAQPDARDFVLRELAAASAQAITAARAAKPEPAEGRALAIEIVEVKHAALLAELRAEQAGKDSEVWTRAAQEAAAQQRRAATLEAELALLKAHTAKDAKKITDADAALAKVRAQADPGTAFKPRAAATFPAISTGRRLAFARWLATAENPLTARVAVNHLWLRHFARGLSITPENLGVSGARPSHPALLDWLAAQFMENGWSMKAVHRLIVTSSTYRMASTPDEANAQLDPDNLLLWRTPSRRMEAELVRDNLLHATGSLDPAMGGPDIDHQQGLTSRRRSLYLRSAAEKEVEFLQIFNGPSVNECYQRHATVMPQQALALANSTLTRAQARALAEQLAGLDPEAFARAAFERILTRTPTADELRVCLAFLENRPRENLALVLFNHHDFVTIR